MLLGLWSLCHLCMFFFNLSKVLSLNSFLLLLSFFNFVIGMQIGKWDFLIGGHGVRVRTQVDDNFR